MEIYYEQIRNIESNTRTALTKKCPILLPVILESRRLVRKLYYNLDCRFKCEKNCPLPQFNLTEHSSPLFRKFNDRGFDERKVVNINLAIKNLNGLVIPPGKVFSFWKYVGKPTQKKGYKSGLVLSDGQLKEDIGGGLCQLSNLLAYMFACTDCLFVERKHHSRDVFPDSGRTIPFASGATVFFNLIDLKIKNTYQFPIKINLRTTDTQLRGSISAPERLEYSIKIKEVDSAFIKSSSKKVYRCNTLDRVYFEKNSNRQIKQKTLWTNIAQVMYDESKIRGQIHLF
jgi:vancomycin resistance protein VanW